MLLRCWQNANCSSIHNNKIIPKPGEQSLRAQLARYGGVRTCRAPPVARAATLRVATSASLAQIWSCYGWALGAFLTLQISCELKAVRNSYISNLRLCFPLKWKLSRQCWRPLVSDAFAKRVCRYPSRVDDGWLLEVHRSNNLNISKIAWYDPPDGTALTGKIVAVSRHNAQRNRSRCRGVFDFSWYVAQNWQDTSSWREYIVRQSHLKVKLRLGPRLSLSTVFIEIRFQESCITIYSNTTISTTEADYTDCRLINSAGFALTC